jgi:hypothetical protein
MGVDGKVEIGVSGVVIYPSGPGLLSLASASDLSVMYTGLSLR